MARYITPAKLTLMVLTALYVEADMPNDAVVPILSFIATHLTDNDGLPEEKPYQHSDRWLKAEQTTRLVISIKDFEVLLRSSTFVTSEPCRKVWDLFIDRLWSINSLDAMMEFLEGLDKMLAKTKEQRRIEADLGIKWKEEKGVKVSRHSIFGSFIRKTKYEFGRMRFADTAELWRQFVKYRQPTFAHMRRKNAGLGRLSFDNVLVHTGHEGWDPERASAVAGRGWDSERASALARVMYGGMLVGDQEADALPVSRTDVNTLLDFLIQQMQKYGCRVPVEVRNQYHDLLNDCFVQPSLRHYLAYLDAWRAGDFVTSFDYLYKYYDYTMQSRDRQFYQYALVNLAVLQADFGCFAEAVSTMMEAVTTARENSDSLCLNFALSWLFHLGRAKPELVRDLESNSMLGTGKDTLSYLRIRAKETGMWGLWSSVLLTEAKFSMIRGESSATILEHIVRSSTVVVSKGLKNMFGSQLSMTVSVWDRIGVSPWGNVISDIFLRCHARDTMYEDELRVICRLALLLADTGRYNEALEKLNTVDANALRSVKAGVTWQKYQAVIRLKRDLHHDDLEGADALLDQLLQAKVDDLEPDMAAMVDSLDLDRLVRRGDLEAAALKVEEQLTEISHKDVDVGQKLRLMLWEVNLLERCGRPLRGFSIAMRAASIALNSRIMPRLYEAIGYISNMLTAVGEFTASLQLLTAIIPRSLECEDSVIPARLYSYLADANMGLAGLARQKEQSLAAALDAVERSFSYWSALEDSGKKCELMAKKAVILRVSGDLRAAAHVAADYRALKDN